MEEVHVCTLRYVCLREISAMFVVLFVAIEVSASPRPHSASQTEREPNVKYLHVTANKDKCIVLSAYTR